MKHLGALILTSIAVGFASVGCAPESDGGDSQSTGGNTSGAGQVSATAGKKLVEELQKAINDYSSAASPEGKSFEDLNSSLESIYADDASVFVGLEDFLFQSFKLPQRPDFEQKGPKRMADILKFLKQASLALQVKKVCAKPFDPETGKELIERDSNKYAFAAISQRGTTPLFLGTEVLTLRAAATGVLVGAHESYLEAKWPQNVPLTDPRCG